MTATYVYVIDAGEDTLYVGHTKNLWLRLKNHACRDWAHRVTKVRAEVFQRKADALERERNLIADLEPEFNVQGNPRHMSWAQFLDWSGIAAEAEA